ncbi:MAG: hypothetical protein KQI62_18935 [Deltaproteobacteria bacterium]|nr:hypothetical protein [Deltaproteobacteria bacterium]
MTNRKMLFFLAGGAALILVAVTIAGCSSRVNTGPPAKQQSSKTKQAGDQPATNETATVEKPAAKAPPPPPAVKKQSVPAAKPTPQEEKAPPPKPEPVIEKPEALPAAKKAEEKVASAPRPVRRTFRYIPPRTAAMPRPQNAPPPGRYPASMASARYITGIEFLMTDQKEDHGYGLFSYLVLTAKPVDNLERERIKALYRSYCSNFSQASALAARGIDKKTINCTFWPLAVHTKDSNAPPGQGQKCTYLSLKLVDPQSRESITRAEECAVDLYDYDRVQVWLNKLEMEVDNGPFIVSSFVPLEELNKKEGVPSMLIMDLTKIHRDQFKEVMMFFRSQVCERPDTWKNYDWDVEWIKVEGLSALHQHAHSAIKFWEWMSGQVSVKSAYAETPR